MKREDFSKLVSEKVLVLDGAMGSMLQARGLGAGQAPEEMNLSKPDVVRGIHEEYIAAGADIILTNTFGGTAQKLGEFGLGKLCDKVNAEAVRIARKAAGKKALVAASIGPCGKLLEPLGEISFDAAYEAFAEQVRALASAGPDMLLLETFSEVRELKAAYVAARDNFPGPIVTLMTFADGKKTSFGTGGTEVVAIFGGLGADGVGTNCSVGPKELIESIESMGRWTALPICVEPNAGTPRVEGGKTIFPLGPEEFCRQSEELVKAGANVIGGCCGTTPEHIGLVKKAVGAMAPRVRREPRVSLLASRSRTVFVGGGQPTEVIGERINPSGNLPLLRELKEAKSGIVRRDARRQVAAGAAILDISVSAADMKNPVAAMVSAVRGVQAATDAIVCIDSTEPDVMEAALKEVEGKAIVNSVSGDDGKLERILPIVKRYGAAVIGLTLDEKGIARTTEDRLRIAEKIVKAAVKLGISPRDVFIDPLVLSAALEPDHVRRALESIALIKGKLGVRTVMGITNVSFGLPRRGLLNAHYLTLALGYGLNLPMINPCDGAMMDAVRATDALIGRDPKALRYIEAMRSRKGGGGTGFQPVAGVWTPRTGFQPVESHGQDGRATRSVRDRLRAAVLDGDSDVVVSLIEEALGEPQDPMVINGEILVPAMEEVGKRFAGGQYFLPQVLLSAETMRAALSRLKDALPPSETVRGRVVLATVKGDVHDIGKNIVGTLLASHGFDVHDLGKSVECGEIVKAAEKLDADIVGLSALMTTTMGQMLPVVKAMREANLRTKVMVGGAVLTGEFAKEIGADGYGKDAVEAVAVAGRLLAQARAGSETSEIGL